ncbi:MAG: DUF4325 domain-containing protein [Bacteroidales bacterium]|nr:DUF4325 domain-containing protein [Bacteroidales bacterium]
MLSSDNIINLDDFRSRDLKKGIVSKVFTGRDRGESVRIKCKIDEIERSYENIKIVIPKDIYSINPSFFEELFINVVKKLGKEAFLQKFQFIYEGYDFEDKLIEAIDRILRENNALDK